MIEQFKRQSANDVRMVKTKILELMKIDELIINPLKSIRKIRQVPAHEIYSNQYDKSLFKSKMK